MKMMKFASEKAMALVDGQLAPSEAPAVIQEIARTPELMRQVQKYLAVHPRQFQAIYADAEREPAPEFLIRTVYQTEMARAPRRRSGFAAKLAELAARTKERYTVPGWSLAAGPALAGALVAVSAYALMPTSSIGAYADASMIVPPLESTVSTSSAQVTFKPVVTYRNRSDELCRQFELKYEGNQSSHAVACRKATGAWQMMMATDVSPSVPKDKSTVAGVKAREPVDKYVDATIIGRIIEHEAEAAALERVRSLRRDALAAKKAAPNAK
jgi:hypothetical protein